MSPSRKTSRDSKFKSSLLTDLRQFDSNLINLRHTKRDVNLSRWKEKTILSPEAILNSVDEPQLDAAIYTSGSGC